MSPSAAGAVWRCIRHGAIARYKCPILPAPRRARVARPNGSRMLRGRTRPWEAAAGPSGIRKQRGGNGSRLPGSRRRAPKRSNLAIRRAKHLSAISVYVPATTTTGDPFHYTSKAPSEERGGDPHHVHPALLAIRTPGRAAPTARPPRASCAATGRRRTNRTYRARLIGGRQEEGSPVSWKPVSR